MLKLIQSILLSVLVFSCESENQTNTIIVDKESFNERNYLETLNSIDRIYEGTETHHSILIDSTSIYYERVVKEEYLENAVGLDFDSVYYNLAEDTLIINNAVFSMGKCDLTFLPYLSFIDDSSVLHIPELFSRNSIEINFDKEDTITSIISCSLVTVYEFKFKIPLSKLENTEHLYFKEEEIKFREL